MGQCFLLKGAAMCMRAANNASYLKNAPMRMIVLRSAYLIESRIHVHGCGAKSLPMKMRPYA